MKKSKLLLNEDTTRKFMKYANIEPLAESFLDNMIEEAEALEEELEELEESDELEEKKHADDDDKKPVEEGYMDEDELGEEMHAEEDEDPADDMGDEDPMADLPEPMPEPEMGAGGGDEDKALDLARGFADLVKDVLGVDVSVSSDDGGDEPALDDESEAEVELGESGLDLEEEYDLSEIELEEGLSDEQINEVTKRVAQRLINMKNES